MTDEEWIEKYNLNYCRLIKEFREVEDSHIHVNQGIVDWLVVHLTEAKLQYYVEGSDYMSDGLYDRYEGFLKIHNPEHPLLKKVGI